MKNVTQEEWRELIQNDENAVILDVRTPGECMEGVIPNAIQMNFMDGAAFVEGLEKLDKSKNYYVYCRSGNRSGAACGIMDEKGFNTYNLLGGMMMWNGEVVEFN